MYLKEYILNFEKQVSSRVVTVRFGSVLRGPGTEPDRRRRNRNRTVRNFVEPEPNRTEPDPNRTEPEP
jgi:hypothetical protein